MEYHHAELVKCFSFFYFHRQSSWCHMIYSMTSNPFTSCFNAIETSVPEATHTLQYLYTLTLDKAGKINFTSVGVLDGVQIDRYDSESQRDVPMVDWMNQGSRFWDAETEDRRNDEGRFSDMMQETFNHSSGKSLSRL